MKKFIKLISAVLAVIVAFSCVNVFASAGSAGYIKTFDVANRNGHDKCCAVNIGVVDKNDILWMWGCNHSYQLGDGIQEECMTPVKIMEDVRSIVLEDNVCAAIKNDNSLWMWGNSRLNHWSEDDKAQKTPLKVMDNVKNIDIDWNNAAVIKTDGTLWVWGYNYNGLMANGNEDDDNYYEPTKIMDCVLSVEVESNHITAIKNDGSLWAWGNRFAYQEDYKGYIEEKAAFHPFKIMDNVMQASVGGDEDLILKKDGTLWKNLFNPEKIMDNVKQISKQEGSNTDVIAIVKKDDSLWCWGSNDFGWTGVGSYGFVEDGEIINSPTKILDNVAFVNLDVDCGAVKKDGSLWRWGLIGVTDVSGGMTVIGLNEEDFKDTFGESRAVPYPVEYKGFKVNLEYEKIMCTVSFELGGGTGTTKTLCAKGELLTPPDNPYRDGYYFAGWYKDSSCTKAWNFDTDKVNSDCTLYAKWLPKSTVTVIADPSRQNIIIDGEEVVLNTYILRDAQGFDVNFVKLRDVAYLLNKTKANFNVDWRNNAIRLDKRKEYTTQNGAELTVPTVVSAPTKTSITPVLTDGVTAPLEAFLLIDDNGGGHNYFKLRDIGKVAGFNVEWDSEKSCIVVTTTESYKE